MIEMVSTYRMRLTAVFLLLLWATVSYAQLGVPVERPLQDDISERYNQARKFYREGTLS
jgi:hypothetical protein